MDDIQREYMLNTKLIRNETEYDITASDIGLDKIRLENYATWKSRGTLYTQRYDKQNNLWSANFMVLPMAGESSLESFAEFPDGTTYYMIDKDSLSIPITFGAKMVNLTDYAKEEHVKKIQSEIYINDELISSVSDKEKLDISKSIEYELQKQEDSSIITLNVKVKSLLLTRFTTDGALTDIKDYTLIVYCKEQEDEEEEEDKFVVVKVSTESYARIEEVPPPEITDVEIKVLSNGTQKELNTANATRSKFVCAGQTIVITATVVNGPADVRIEFQGDKSINTFDDTTKKFEWEEPRARNVATFLKTLDEYKTMYSESVFLKEKKDITKKEKEAGIRKYEYTYIIPYETKQTLNSWSTLRKGSKDAFNIDDKKMFTRIASPYQIVVKAKNDLGADTYRYSIDVFERWDTLYNRDLRSYVTGAYTQYGER